MSTKRSSLSVDTKELDELMAQLTAFTDENKYKMETFKCSERPRVTHQVIYIPDETRKRVLFPKLLQIFGSSVDSENKFMVFIKSTTGSMDSKISFNMLERIANGFKMGLIKSDERDPAIMVDIMRNFRLGATRCLVLPDNQVSPEASTPEWEEMKNTVLFINLDVPTSKRALDKRMHLTGESDKNMIFVVSLVTPMEDGLVKQMKSGLHQIS